VAPVASIGKCGRQDDRRDGDVSGRSGHFAKQYSSKIPVEAVRALAGTVALERAGKGILVTTSSLIPAAYKIQQDNPRIELIDGQGLLALIKKYTGRQMRIEFTRSQPRRSGSRVLSGRCRRRCAAGWWSTCAGWWTSPAAVSVRWSR
jgi:Restriction endonuclease